MGSIGPGELLIILMILLLLGGGIGGIILVIMLAGKGARCSACRRRVAKRATMCPHCGVPLPGLLAPM
jgi:hypothetical protein